MYLYNETLYGILYTLSVHTHLRNKNSTRNRSSEVTDARDALGGAKGQQDFFSLLK